MPDHAKRPANPLEMGAERQSLFAHLLRENWGKQRREQLRPLRTHSKDALGEFERCRSD
ncbi:MAG: hypothetical protein LC770_04100 [Acidobacteria bacterium]|nr:hypothetical protein [Acidobacteriota bacterium]